MNMDSDTDSDNDGHPPGPESFHQAPSGSEFSESEIIQKLNGCPLKDGRLIFAFGKYKKSRSALSSVFRMFCRVKEPDCPLTDLIYGSSSAEKEWRKFLDCLPYSSEMLFLNEFCKKYADVPEFSAFFSGGKQDSYNSCDPYDSCNLPAVIFTYTDASGNPVVTKLIGRDRISRCDKISCFRKVVLRYLEKNLIDAEISEERAANSAMTPDSYTSGESRNSGSFKCSGSAEDDGAENSSSSRSDYDEYSDDEYDEIDENDWARRKEVREMLHDIDVFDEDE